MLVSRGASFQYLALGAILSFVLDVLLRVGAVDGLITWVESQGGVAFRELRQESRHVIFANILPG